MRASTALAARIQSGIGVGPGHRARGRQLGVVEQLADDRVVHAGEQRLRQPHGALQPRVEL